MLTWKDAIKEERKVLVSAYCINTRWEDFSEDIFKYMEYEYPTYSSFEIIKFLVARGAMIGSEPGEDVFPVMIACNRGRLDVVQLSLDLRIHLW